MRKLISLIAFVVVFVIVLVGAKAFYDEYKGKIKIETTTTQIVQPTTEPKQTTDQFKTNDPIVYTKDNQALQLSSLSNKPKIFFFWASWCHYCQMSFPNYIALYEKYKDQVDFAFVNIPDGQRETKEKGLQFLKDKNYDVPVYFDLDLNYAHRYQIYYFPATIAMAKDNQFDQLFKGALTKALLEEKIQSLLQ